ncbi:unnamed protein product [Musa acuminata subsp. malaccensis]|nr:unnamed protein product [Musa acuminata subsp. malaccensis]
MYTYKKHPEKKEESIRILTTQLIQPLHYLHDISE